MTRPAPIIAGTLAALLLLFGAYVGAYYAVLEGQNQQIYPHLHEPNLPPKAPTLEADYRLSSGFVEAIFAPAHQLDRLIRPVYWGVE